MNGPLSHTLACPITMTFNSGKPDERTETVAEVTIRAPKARDMRVVDKHTGQVAQSLAMIAQLTGLAIMQVDELDVVDVTAIGDIIEGFTKPGPPIGQTP